MGAAGSLTMLLNDAALYSMESINARSKMIAGENVGMVEMTKRIVKTEGISALYRGYSASFYSIITHGFLYMYFYKATKVFMKDHFKPESKLANACIYALSSTLAQSVDLLCYPFEMIRIRLLAMNDHYAYRSVSHAIRSILKEQGIRGLYQGATPYFLNLIGVYSLSLTLYELLMDHFLLNSVSQAHFAQHETRYVIYSSVLSSLATVLVMNIFEVMVIRMLAGSQ
jgi:Mitochondrial carrier protein